MTRPTSILSIPFDIKVQHWELQFIRAAVANDVLSKKPLFEAAGLATDYFHNHDEADDRDGRTVNRYPLIQYTEKNDYLCLLAVGPAVDALLFYLKHMPGRLQFRNRIVAMLPVLSYARFQHYTAEILEKPAKYQLRQWIGLQEHRHAIWKQTPRMEDRVQLLNEALMGSVKRMLTEGLNQSLDPAAECYLHDIFQADHTTYKKRQWRCFTLEFYSNLLLPAELGLGKGCSIGYGKLLAPASLIKAVPAFPDANARTGVL